MVWISAGSSQMGSSEIEQGRSSELGIRLYGQINGIYLVNDLVSIYGFGNGFTQG